MARANITDIPTSRAIYTPSELTTFSLMAPGDSTTYVYSQLPRQFRPGRAGIYFPLGQFPGIVVTDAQITGSTLIGWSATFTLNNVSSSNITPTAQQVVIYQEA